MALVALVAGCKDIFWCWNSDKTDFNIPNDLSLCQEKHEYLRSKFGVKYITSSRSGIKFEEDMKTFLAEEGVDGVDVVLNSLSHDDYISRSLACLKSGGRFIEIGKRGIWTHQ